jgi:hypothetical protein
MGGADLLIATSPLAFGSRTISTDGGYVKPILFAILAVACLTSPAFADSKPPHQPASPRAPAPAQPPPPTYLLASPQLLEAIEHGFEKVSIKAEIAPDVSSKPNAGGLLGITTSSWLAIATGVYAFGTLLLAFVTSQASKRALKSAADATAIQVQASAKNVERQVAASAEAVTQQVAASRDAAIIQARASSISNNRQQWINSLRDEVTGFLTDADMLFVVQNDMAISDERNEQFLRIGRALRSHIFKVRLLINPTEGESCQLVEMMTEVRNVGGLTDEARERIVSHTQAILKTEWERVKSGA